MRNGGAGEQSRWRSAAAIAGCTVLFACDAGGERAPAPGNDSSAPQTIAYRWEIDTIDTIDAPRFRAFGWAHDTLWGIARGRLAFVGPAGLVVETDTAWGVWTAPRGGEVSWANEQGVFVRSAGSASRVLGPGDAPQGGDFAPVITWNDHGRALLIWTSEAGPALSVMERDGISYRQRMLFAKLPGGEHTSSTAVWLDSVRVAIGTVAMSARSGPSEHRESGYRGNIAVLDVRRDSIALVTDVDDGTFLRPEGLLAADSLLAAVHGPTAHATNHVTVALGSWSQRPRLEQPGRAAACARHIALLFPVSDLSAGGEITWTASLHDAAGSSTEVGRFTGYDVRLLWDAGCTQLAIAQESERAGMRTVRVRQVR